MKISLKLNIILTLIAMVVLSITDYGWVKAICLVGLMINFCIFMAIFEEAYDER